MKTNELKFKFDEYMDYLDVKEISKNSYRKMLNKWYDYITTLSIKYAKRNDVLKYKEYLLKNYSSSTVQKHIVVLKGFYKYCNVEGYCDNITLGVKGTKVSPSFQRQALSPEEAIRLLERAEMVPNRRNGEILTKRNYAIVALMLTTGLRVIEVARSDVDDIDIIDGEYVIHIMGKGRDSKDDYVKLSTEVHDIIYDYLEERDNGHEALFITHHRRFDNSRLSTKRISTIVKDLLVSIGYTSKAYSAHSLRHTFATTALKEGASLLETKEALRHSDVSTTQIYVDMIESKEASTFQKVSDVLFKKKK